MEIQKFRILRPLTYDPSGNVITNARDINWTIPCSGTTDLWPLNISANCTGTTIYDSNFSEVIAFMNNNSTFPDKLKDCSITNPCVIVDDTSYTTNPNFCTNIGGYKYLLFKGLNITYNGTPNILGSYNELSSVVEGWHTGTVSVLPNHLPCTCNVLSQLGTDISKLSIFLGQDYNDIGHYDIWDGNIGQQDTFGNFILSATSSSGYQMTAYRTTDIAYHADIKTSNFTIDWGDGTVIDYGASHSQSNTYLVGAQKQYKIVVTQDTPWGSKSVSKVVTIPHFGYPVMFNLPVSQPTGESSPTTYPNIGGPGSGITSNQVTLTGLGTDDGSGTGVISVGTSIAYHGIYGTLGTRDYFPLDSATDIDQFSATTYGVTSADAEPCYTVSGITDSMLGNFQTYTTGQTGNLPMGYQQGVIVPIGGDVINPITNTLQTGVFGRIELEVPGAYTAYTISSAYGASGGYANGDTPINLYDFSNGITIFEAETCGLNKMTWGALACIDCPEDNCHWCKNKDEYIDRTDGVAYEITSTNPTGVWEPAPSPNYSVGDIVYDITWNACCCYICVEPIVPGDSWYGISPSSMMEGIWGGVHIWEACSDECVSCPQGTQSPCNDTSLNHSFIDSVAPNVNKAAYYNAGNNYTIGDYAKGGNGNCYEAKNSSNPLANPTGASGTIDWEYIGCVAWDCPTDINASDCVMISGKTDTSSMDYIGCKESFDDDECFDSQWTCDIPKYACGGCSEIYPGDVGYGTADAYQNQTLCKSTCSPQAYSCSTPTSLNCCVTFSCGGPLENAAYEAHVKTAITAIGDNPNALVTNAGLFMSPTFTINDCTNDHPTDACCVYSSFTWNCEQGCVTQNSVGGYASFGLCVNDSNTNTLLNPNIGKINPASPIGALYKSNGTGLYDAVENNIPCGWSCGTITEIYSPHYADPGTDTNADSNIWGDADDIDPLGLGQYLSPCEPCFILGCGVETTEESCAIICSAATSCYVCDCLDYMSCSLVLDCPTFSDLGHTGYGANNGVDTGLYHTTDAGVYTTVSGTDPVLTYSAQTDCQSACGCGGWDCVVHHPDSPLYNYLDTQIKTGDGCKYWTEIQLNDSQYTWSQNNPYGTAYTDFHDCCDNEPNCCAAACVDCTRYPNICDDANVVPTYPCQYVDADQTPFPYPLYFSIEVPQTVPPMVECLSSILTVPGLSWPDNLACEMYSDCACACSGMTQPSGWLTTYYFATWSTNNPGLAVPLNHQGEWDEVFFDNFGVPLSLITYQSGDTVTHEQPIAYSSPCCYVCACVEGVGNLANGMIMDCNHFEPGAGPNITTGQNNCWIDCQAQEAIPGFTCLSCTGSQASTYSCGNGANGCQPSLCNYTPFGITSEWETLNDCYLSSFCGGECFHGCGCNTATTISECVMMQDAINYINGDPNNYNIDVFPIPTLWGNPDLTQCNTVLNLGTDCCNPIGTTYDCLVGTACTSDNSTVLGGPFQTGCVAVYPPLIGAFNFTNLTQLVAGVGNVTFADPLEACKAYCTWACQNNAGCDFEPWWNYPGPVWNNAYDCWWNSGMDCSNCNETYFCYTANTPTQIVTASDLATFGPPNSGQPEHDMAFGPGQLTYNQLNGSGFPSIILCQDQCRFTCNSDPAHCGCELDWGNAAGSATIDDCANYQVSIGGTYNAGIGNCCFAEWWCMPTDGCKGYMSNQLVADGGPGAPAYNGGGPYYQIGGAPGGDGELGCLQFCGFVCGDGWEDYLGQCACAWVHNDDDPTLQLPIGDGIVIYGDGGVYNTLNDCNNASTGSVVGNAGCCNCYNCTFLTVQNGGVPYPSASNLVYTAPFSTTWLSSGTSTVPSDIGETNPDDWDQTGSEIYNQGQSVKYSGGNPATNCCYVYNGCCDDAVHSCLDSQNLLCDDGSGGGFQPLDYLVDPHTAWITYQTMLTTASPVITGSMGPPPTGAGGPPAWTLPGYEGLLPNDTAVVGWTAGPTWIPCDQGCPTP